MELVLVGSVPDYWSEGSRVPKVSGLLSDLGLAVGPQQPIVRRQPIEGNPDPGIRRYGYTIACGGDGGGCGAAFLQEQLAYDVHYRSDIGVTGLRITLELREDIFEGLRCMIEDATFKAGVHRFDFPTMIIRLPAPALTFPASRGELHPTAESAPLGELEDVARFQIDCLNVALVGKTPTVRDGISSSASIQASRSFC